MKTQIRPVDRGMGIYRVAICVTDDNGVNTWHRFRGTESGCIAFCRRFGKDYTVNE